MDGFRAESRLTGVAVHLPERVVTTDALERYCGLTRVGYSPGELERACGIRTRHHAPPGTQPSDLALAAARVALERASLRPDQLDVILYAAASRDQVEPASAHAVQHQLGASGAYALDVSNACTSMLDGALLADTLIASGRARRVLVCGGEVASRLVEPLRARLAELDSRGQAAPYLATLTLGDAGAALVLEASAERGHRLERWSRFTVSDQRGLCVLPSLEEPMVTQGRELIALGATRGPEAVRALVAACGWPEEGHWLASHQVNVGAHHYAADRCGIPSERAPLVVDRIGNAASATVVAALDEIVRSDAFQTGDRLILAAVGSGVTGVVASVVW